MHKDLIKFTRDIFIHAYAKKYLACKTRGLRNFRAWSVAWLCSYTVTFLSCKRKSLSGPKEPIVWPCQYWKEFRRRKVSVVTVHCYGWIQMKIPSQFVFGSCGTCLNLCHVAQHLSHCWAGIFLHSNSVDDSEDYIDNGMLPMLWYLRGIWVLYILTPALQVT